jgi:8-amino-7-oxononanoate synthase
MRSTTGRWADEGRQRVRELCSGGWRGYGLRPVSLDDDARAELADLEVTHRVRLPRVVDRAQGRRVVLDGVEVTNFASNDYLGLAADPRVVEAARAAAEEVGVGAGASRLIVGNHRRLVTLEAAIADWMHYDGACVFASGYAANVGVISTLARPDDVLFSDELNHASIIDGARLSRARVVVYPHLDSTALELALEGVGGRRRIVVSESLFSMDGDVADVVELSRVCRRHDAVLVLDEAHALGARGPEGRGIAADVGVVPDVVLGTCGKSLGGSGAFAVSSAPVVQLLWNRARSLVFSTALPAMVCAGVEEAIRIVRSREGDAMRAVLAGHAGRLRTAVAGITGERSSAIAPLVIGDDRATLEMSARLLERGMFVHGIRPPTVPEGTSRLRISLSAAHRGSDVERLVDALDDAVRR